MLAQMPLLQRYGALDETPNDETPKDKAAKTPRRYPYPPMRMARADNYFFAGRAVFAGPYFIR